MEEESKMVLRTEDLVKKYGKRTVVSHVSINVKQGEIVGLLGPNGAGKTTSFYMTVGLITPNEGRIFLDDLDITKYPVYKRAQTGIGYLAQEASVFRQMSVEDNIAAVLEMTDKPLDYQKDKLESLIAEFRLQKVRKNKGNQLSGGERRRTEIARCLAIDPKFIMLDEPFAGLDAENRRHGAECIARRAETTPVLLVTHDQADLEALNARNIGWNGKKYTAYEISQMQRARERNVRRWKKRYLAEDAAGLDATDSAVRLKAARQSLADFAQATGGRVDSARTSVPKFGRSEAGRASAKSQAHHTDWLKSINAQSTSLNTVAKYYDARYNNTEEYRLLMQYANSVKSGWLSPLAGFDLYKSTHERIQTELVGKTTADGTVITGHTAHFMERMFGTLVDPDKLKYDLKIIRRSGVGYEAMRDTVLNPERINPVKTDSRGKRSVRLIGKAIVTINPDTGQLIQLNPRSEQK